MKFGKTLMILLALPSACFLMAGISPAAAGEAGKLVEKGNRNFEKGDYDRAIQYYDKASVEKPESAVIHFNRGGALFKSGDYGGAAEQFRIAAEKTRDLGLEARAWYNMGNCSFMEGQRQSDSDLEKALESYRQSVGFYQTALEKDSTLTDAALNMEVARLVIKDMLDKIKRRKEQMEQQREKMKEVLDSLASLARRQQQAVQEGKKTSSGKASGSPDWRESARKLEREQDDIRKGTEEVREKLEELGSGRSAPPLEEASSHVDSSLTAQDAALGELSESRPENAGKGQEESLRQIKKAIESLSDNRNQGEKDQSGENRERGDEKQRQPGESPPDQGQRKESTERPEQQTAMEILEREKEDREKRRRQASSGYRRVEKDW